MSYSIRWLGHATFHIVTEAGTHIYLDPWITGNPVCPVALDSIERADIAAVVPIHCGYLQPRAGLLERVWKSANTLYDVV